MTKTVALRLSMLLIFLTLIQICFADPISIGGIESLGMTIDPVTYKSGNNIFDISMCDYESYYIPCGTAVEPYITTDIKIVTTAYSKTHEYDFDENSKVDVQASADFKLFKASGKYSSTSEENVKTMISSNSSLVVSEATSTLYRVTANMVSMKLNPELDAIINKTVQADLNGDEKEFEYWVSVLYEEFPPGVKITGITGGKMHQVTYIANDYYHNTAKETVEKSGSASCSFSTVFSASGSYNWGVTQQQIDDYEESINSFESHVIGGSFTPTTSLSDWISSVRSYPMLLDYTIDLSLFWLRPGMWPQYPRDSIDRLYNSYVYTYVPYFAGNTHYGCTDPYGMNFQLAYNTDDGSCSFDYPITSTFGGLYSYQRNSRSGWGSYSNNPLGDGLNCPVGSTAYCQTLEYGIDWSVNNFDCYDATGYMNCYITSNTIWFCHCAGELEHPNGPAFGGVYTNEIPNPVTDGFNCPPGTIDQTIQSAHWCYGKNAPSAIFGGIYYQLSSNVHQPGYANAPSCWKNPYTNDCSCPETAPNVVEFYDWYYNDKELESWKLRGYVCIGNATFVIGKDIGKPFNYIPPNYTYASGNNTTGTTSGTTSGNNKGHKNDDVIYYIVIPIVVIIAAIIAIVITIVIIYLARMKSSRNSYSQI